MNMWRGAKVRGVGLILASAALMVCLASCGGGGDGAKGEGSGKASGTSSSAPVDKEPEEGAGDSTTLDESQTLATIDGSNGFQFVIHTAQREQGGFLTVTGTIRNNSGKRQVTPLEWSGDEDQVRKTGPSLAGMTLVDKVEKKRYYVLRDTDGNPLTTTAMNGLDANESMPFFAQFPAPPDSTTSVSLQLPLLGTATIEIS